MVAPLIQNIIPLHARAQKWLEKIEYVGYSLATAPNSCVNWVEARCLLSHFFPNQNVCASYLLKMWRWAIQFFICFLIVPLSKPVVMILIWTIMTSLPRIGRVNKWWSCIECSRVATPRVNVQWKWHFTLLPSAQYMTIMTHYYWIQNLGLLLLTIEFHIFTFFSVFHLLFSLSTRPAAFAPHRKLFYWSYTNLLRLFSIFVFFTLVIKKRLISTKLSTK